jgi:uncharacterized protein involved in response to NO
MSVLSIAIVFGIVEAFMLTFFPEQALPATVMVFGGWLIAMFLTRKIRLRATRILPK